MLSPLKIPIMNEVYVRHLSGKLLLLRSNVKS